jgi:hypothetical protein
MLDGLLSHSLTVAPLRQFLEVRLPLRARGGLPPIAGFGQVERHIDLDELANLKPAGEDASEQDRLQQIVDQVCDTSTRAKLVALFDLT